MIKIQNLNKSFKTQEVETLALNNISFKVDNAEFTAIMGPSGCGKSTLLNIIGMLDKPNSGSYEFNGEEVGNYNEKQYTELRKSNIGFVFQKFNLNRISKRLFFS